MPERTKARPTRRKLVLWRHPTKGITIDTPGGRVFGVTKEQAHEAVEEFFAKAEKWKVSTGGRPRAAE